MNKCDLIINDERVPFTAVQQEAERMRPHYDQMVRQRNRVSSDDELYKWARENVIETTLLAQEAAKRFPSDTQSAPASNASNIPQLIEEVCAHVPAPTEKEMKEIYNKYRNMFISPEQVHASHIVRHAKTPAERTGAFLALSEAKQALDNGESFESVAARMSDCAGQSGDLGVFPRGQMVQEFEDVVFAMKPGERSDIFLTDFGYHIAKLNRKIPPKPLKFEAVKTNIHQQMMTERKQLKLNAFVDELKKNAVIMDT